MTDEIAGLKEDWQRQDTDISELRARLEAARSRARSKLAAEIATTAVGIAAGIGYAVWAWLWRDLLFAFSALVMLLFLPCQAIPGLRLRRRSLDFPDRTPEGTLRYRVNLLTLNIRILRLQLWGCATLVLLTAAVWAGVAAGWIGRSYPPFLVPTVIHIVIPIITGSWLLAALIGSLYCRWRLRRARAELASGEEMLAAFLAARQEDLPGGTLRAAPPW